MKNIISLLLISINTFAQTELWTKETFYTLQNLVGGITCDSLNNIYVAGRFEPGVHEPVSSNYKGFYRKKYDINGNELWSDTTRLVGAYSNLSIAGNRAGDNYIGGSCGRTFNVGGITVNLPVSSSLNGFLIKTNSSGTVLLGKGFYKAAPTSITYLHDGAIYVCGFAAALTSIDGISTSAGGFIAKFNSAGVCQKVIHTGSTKVLMSAADSTGNLYVILGDLSDPKFICKYDQNDSLLWTKSLGNAIMLGLSVDADENVYFSYSMMSSVITNKLDRNGDIVWNTNATFYYPNGNIYHDRNSPVYYCITTRNDSIKASYLGTYDDSDGTFISYETVILPTGYDLYVKTKIIKDHQGSLIVGGELQSDFKKVCVKKFSFSPVAGIRNNELTSDFSVYPNPSHGIFQISYTSAAKGNLTIDVINTKGQRVYSESIQEFSGELRRDIDLGNYAKGIYTIEIIADKKRKVRKVVLN